MLLLAGGIAIQLTGAAHWQDLVTMLTLRRQVALPGTATLGMLSLLVISLLLKTGAAPLHF